MTALALVAIFVTAGVVGWAGLVFMDALCDIHEAGERAEELIRRGTCPPRRQRPVDSPAGRSFATDCPRLSVVRGEGRVADTTPSPRDHGGERVTFEQEHLIDPRDLCDATVLLDDLEVIVEVVERDEPMPRGYRPSRPSGVNFQGHNTRVREDER